VDFWWIDWQQGTRSKLHGLDPLMALNHLHYYDLGRDGSKRPFIFSRWFGPGNQRYPIGFSGDTVVSWESLAFQPHFTATAANVGYGWWSHDIGGHMWGVEDEELYARWIQFGVFSPILRLHSTKNAYQDRRPWATDAETFRVIRAAMQLRHQLIPYIYSMAWRNHIQHLPLITPMYYLAPESGDAYRCPQQYAFGTELIAAPFTSPIDSHTRLSRQTVWLPSGQWFNFFDGERFNGQRWYSVYGRLDDIPVFAKAGAIILLAAGGENGVQNPTRLDVHIFPGAHNRFDLYEDDGATAAYQAGHYAVTTFTQNYHAMGTEFSIEPATGDRAALPAQRHYRLIFRAVPQPDRVEVRVNDELQTVTTSSDATRELFSIEDLIVAPTDRVVVTLQVTNAPWLADTDRRAATCRALLRTFHLASAVKEEIDRDLPLIFEDVNRLQSYGADLKDVHIAALTSVIRRETSYRV
jgi:alpha-glucosidase (family GH31 glycosyl hydrolase)